MERPHVVLLPTPGQGHINPMLHLAKLLHSKGFYITFINTEFSHQSFLRSEGPDALNGLEGFRFETIPDGLLLSSAKSRQKVVKWCLSVFENCVDPLRELLVRLNSSSGVPSITCIMYNWLMSFALDVAEELGIASLVFCPTAACSFMCSLHLEELIQRGYTPLKDENQLTNGYLDTTIDWIPGMKGMRLRDLSSFIRTTDGDDHFLNYDNENSKKCSKSHGLIINTLECLESEILDALKGMFPKVYTVGPLHELVSHVTKCSKSAMQLNFWEGDTEGCMEWLNTQKDCSVMYVNFGSLATVTKEQLTEFAWGLADSGHSFLWVIRPDMVVGESGHELMPKDFIAEITKERGFVTSWCSQEAVLSHKSIGGFLTHVGWNSALESICCGVPMICWPGFADQHLNCWYVCSEWGIGVEIHEEVKREQVGSMVKDLLEGEKGKEMRKNVMKWKDKAKEAIAQGGTSYEDLNRLATDLSTM